MEISTYTLSVILGLFTIAAFVWFDRANFKRQGFILLRHTQKGKQIIQNLANNHPKFWRAYGNIAMIVFIPAMIITVYLFAQSINIMYNVPQTKGTGLILPNVVSPETKLFTGGIAINFWHWVIAIAIIAVVHELAHGIIAIREGIKVKSLGVVLFGPILGAFVEPDEKQMKKANWKKTARMVSAGPFTNFVFTIIFLLMLVGSFNYLYETQGIEFVSVENSPMNQSGINYGVIKSINNATINNYNDLLSFMSTTSPNQIVTVTYLDSNLEEKVNQVTLSQHPENETVGFIGVSPYNVVQTSIIEAFGPAYTYRTPKFAQSTVTFFTDLVAWLFILNLAVGMFNVLPAKPLDGGLIWEAYMKRFLPKKGEKVAKWTANIIYAMLLLLLLIIIRDIFLGFI